MTMVSSVLVERIQSSDEDDRPHGQIYPDFESYSLGLISWDTGQNAKIS